MVSHSSRTALGHEVLEQVVGAVDIRVLEDVVLDGATEIAVLANCTHVEESYAEMGCLAASGVAERHSDAERHRTSQLRCSDCADVQSIHGAEVVELVVMNALNLVLENLADLRVCCNEPLCRNGEEQLDELTGELVRDTNAMHIIVNGDGECCVQEELANLGQLVAKGCRTHRRVDESKELAKSMVEGVVIYVSRHVVCGRKQRRCCLRDKR